MSKTILKLDRIIQGNCIEVLDTFPAASVDMVFADPPYNLQLRQELWRPNRTKVDGVDNDWDQFDSFTEYDDFTRQWLSACRRVLKDTGTLWVIGTYHNIYRVGALIQDLGFWILNDIVWIKTNPMPNFRGVRFTNAHETLIWAQKKKGARYTFNHHSMKALNDDLQMRSDWLLPLCTGQERIKIDGKKAHPTQKPEALLYRVITASTNPGDVVLDPFFGSGTTGVAAKRLHRRWIGIESNPDYIQIAKDRIASIADTAFSVTTFASQQRASTLKRIPFGRLLECNLLSPGQALYFEGKDTPQAVILANSHIRCDSLEGSIHQVASKLHNAPSNGWKCWYYLDEESGKRIVIDNLRNKIRLEKEI
ncbi:MAG: site-specific DNA-methyltransferase [Anaerolineales bacterium]|nr:site-specific DNA-methyltransferase [Anaerolineales bacterium]